MKNPEALRHQENAETLHSHEMALCMSTWYPTYGESQTTPLDTLRGNLALESVMAAINQGYQIVLVDGGSSDTFIDLLREYSRGKVRILKQSQPGMSASRRQAYHEAAALPGVKVLTWLEAEKSPLISDKLLNVGRELLAQDADIAIPHRTTAGFASYPPQQALWEQRLNKTFQEEFQFFGTTIPEYDMSFGPKVFRNESSVLNLFSEQFSYRPMNRHLERVYDPTTQTYKLDTNPERWSNTLTLPVARAIRNGLKVISVETEYVHPAQQTLFETENPEFNKKRIRQYLDQVTTLVQFLSQPS